MQIDMEKLGAIVGSVIAQEGPIHRDEIVRRIGHLFGKQRVSPCIAAAIKRALTLLADQAPDLCHEADFWFTPGQGNAPIVRDRSAAPTNLRKLDRIATSEIRAAMAIARRQNDSLRDDELAHAVASLLGLPKTTAEMLYAPAIAGGVNAGEERAARLLARNTWSRRQGRLSRSVSTSSPS
jgi:Protein of unknown function (DUF3320)